MVWLSPMERIALDMDEVMADTLGHQLNWLKKNYGCTLSKAAAH
jgi:hypothetical protein